MLKKTKFIILALLLALLFSCKTSIKPENKRLDFYKNYQVEDKQEENPLKKKISEKNLFFTDAKEMYSHIDKRSSLDLVKDDQKDKNFLYFTLLLKESNPFYMKLKEHLFDGKIMIRLDRKKAVLLNIKEKEEKRFDLKGSLWTSFKSLFSKKFSDQDAINYVLKQKKLQYKINEGDPRALASLKGAKNFEDSAAVIEKLKIGDETLDISEQMLKDMRGGVNFTLHNGKKITLEAIDKYHVRSKELGEKLNEVFKKVKELEDIKDIDQQLIKKRLILALETRVQTNEAPYTTFVAKKSKADIQLRSDSEAKGEMIDISISKEGLVTCKTTKGYKLANNMGPSSDEAPSDIAKFSFTRTMTVDLKTGNLSEEIVEFKLKEGERTMTADLKTGKSSDEIVKYKLKARDYKFPIVLGALAVSSLSAFYFSGLFDSKKERSQSELEDQTQKGEESKQAFVKPYKASLFLDQDEEADLFSYKTQEKIKNFYMILKKGIYADLDFFSIED